ncbi:hypothetical protein MXB_4015 [Myxobolus squamalis]|nr:hypothetical protein MXB_4015 [Myxobolus squamalis]
MVYDENYLHSDMSLKGQEESLKKENFDLKLKLYMEQKENEKMSSAVEKQEKIILGTKKNLYCLKERCKFLESELLKLGYSLSNYSSGFNSVSTYSSKYENCYPEDGKPEHNNGSYSPTSNFSKNNQYANGNNGWIASKGPEDTVKLKSHVASNSFLSKLSDKNIEINLDNGQEFIKNRNIPKENEIKSMVHYPTNSSIFHINNNQSLSCNQKNLNASILNNLKSPKVIPKTRYFFGCMSNSAVKDETDPSSCNASDGSLKINEYSTLKNMPLKKALDIKSKKMKGRKNGKGIDNSNESSIV